MGTMKFFYGCRGSRLFNRRALIIGAGSAGRAIAQALAKHGDNTCQIIGFVNDDPAREGTTVHIDTLNFPTCKVLGNSHALPELIAQHNVTTLILAITHKVNIKLLGILQALFFRPKHGSENGGTCSRPTSFAPWSLMARKRGPYGLRKMTHGSAALGAF